MATPRELDTVNVADIVVPDGRRAVHEDAVASLVSSMAEIGLQTPITIRIVNDMEIDGFPTDGVPVLVTGAHRLAAAKSLGWPSIEAWVVDYDNEKQAQLWEIDENLMRAELTPADRASCIARRKAIYEELHPETRHGVAGAKARHGSANENFSFAADTAKRTGRSERIVQMDAERGERICSDVLAVIRGTKLDKGTYLDGLKKLPEPEQVNKVEKDLAKLRAEQFEAEQRKESEKERRAKDRAIALTQADEFAEWLASRISPSELPTLISWLECSKPRDVIGALRRVSSVAPVFDRSRSGEAA